jgi:hypothetical protein
VGRVPGTGSQVWACATLPSITDPLPSVECHLCLTISGDLLLAASSGVDRSSSCVKQTRAWHTSQNEWHQKLQCQPHTGLPFCPAVPVCPRRRWDKRDSEFLLQRYALKSLTQVCIENLELVKQICIEAQLPG